MERLAIINHDNHTLYVIDVTDEVLELYKGEEEAYIDEQFGFENYSWDWIVDAYHELHELENENKQKQQQ